MDELFAALSLVLLLTMNAGLVRVWIGPTPADRMMAAQLLGTSGIGALLLLAPALHEPALVDVALVFALLAAVAVAAFTRRRAGSDPADVEAE
ncbi:MAG: monovalent cation/H+ antiporter complex subunit F [Thiohalocapsa sp.]